MFSRLVSYFFWNAFLFISFQVVLFIVGNYFKFDVFCRLYMLVLGRMVVVCVAAEFPAGNNFWSRHDWIDR